MNNEKLEELLVAVQSLKAQPPPEGVLPNKNNAVYKILLGALFTVLVPIIGVSYKLGTEQEALAAAIREVKIELNSNCQFEIANIRAEVNLLRLQLDYLSKDKDREVN